MICVKEWKNQFFVLIGIVNAGIIRGIIYVFGMNISNLLEIVALQKLRLGVQ